MSHDNELFESRPSTDPLGIITYKKSFNLETFKQAGHWVAIIRGDRWHFSYSAATEIKALDRLAQAEGYPVFLQWKLAKMKEAADAKR